MYDLLAKTRPPVFKRIADGESLEVPLRVKWLIIGGKISHVNGTDSVLTMEYEGREMNKMTVEADFASQYVGVYQQQMIDNIGGGSPAATRELGGSFCWWIAGSKTVVKFNGGTDSYVDIQILEVQEVL